MATAMLPLLELAKRWNFNSVLKTQQSLLEYYCDLSFLLFPRRKGYILSIIPNSKVVLLSLIVLAKKIPKKTHATISGTNNLRRNDPKNKTQGIVFNPDVGITN